jgi:general secretion pathway protein I
MSACRRRGFTLIEVLVALAVVALALLGLTRTAALEVRDFDALRERTLAGWVAANVLADARLATALPSTGRSDGHVEFASRQWRWTRDVRATPDPELRRIDIQVFAGQAREPSASLSGFAGAAVVP